MSDKAAFERAVKSKWSDSYIFNLEASGCYVDEILEAMFWAWQASRQALSSCSEIPNSSDHIADAGEMVKGNAVAMGEIVDEHGAIYGRSMMIQFDGDDDIRAAIKSGQCRFTVFGGSV